MHLDLYLFSERIVVTYRTSQHSTCKVVHFEAVSRIFPLFILIIEPYPIIYLCCINLICTISYTYRTVPTVCASSFCRVCTVVKGKAPVCPFLFTPFSPSLIHTSPSIDFFFCHHPGSRSIFEWQQKGDGTGFCVCVCVSPVGARRADRRA